MFTYFQQLYVVHAYENIHTPRQGNITARMLVFLIKHTIISANYTYNNSNVNPLMYKH